MTFTAGQQLRAPQLRSLFPQLTTLPSDAAITSSTVLTDTAGLSLSLEPRSRYIFDGYVAFDSSATAEITFGFRAPPGATGHWAVLGSDVSAPGLDVYVATTFSDASYAFSEGAATGQVLFPHGYIVTSGASGALQFRFAQGTSDASATSLRKGSWLRLTRIS